MRKLLRKERKIIFPKSYESVKTHFSIGASYFIGIKYEEKGIKSVLEKSIFLFGNYKACTVN